MPASKTNNASPVHQVTRLPVRDATAEVDGGLASSVLETVAPVSSITSTLGCAPDLAGRYTAVLFCDTTNTRAPEPGRTPGSGTMRWMGSSSSLPGRNSTSRRSAWFVHASSTDTAAELAAADSSVHPDCRPRFDGFTRASISP
ncbi:Uncharacterised protein [Mycobacterium tuberculosis]|uniref:Uncharacterized protein n=2 Tax=Mycobacterium tuberculosis TaxID=1773 RepID=A0A655FSG1_MYCTX|nr:Uncharacterised protein [Mycobacterium tuberculosis]